MGPNVCSLLAVGLILSLMHIVQVRSQCTTTFCNGDDTDERALTAMLYRLQDTLERQQDTIRRQQDTLELQQKQLMRHEEILAKLQTCMYP
ncbi:hypothetical protein NP493_265g03042 [Ridgeia piscesae]|uniref:Uncharacterized protein n=1 Tax=Ridgeia piscesae TaxID=27915 RepID=A0AAD9NXZ8_RIDPI|nr:hypothetical protein NP493_265g03042 [Ridgeia piscesae]